MKITNLLESHKLLDVPTMSVAQLAKHHNVSITFINKQLKRGIEVESEHTSDKKVAAEIARDHIKEDPKYYIKLATIEKD